MFRCSNWEGREGICSQTPTSSSARFCGRDEGAWCPPAPESVSRSAGVALVFEVCCVPVVAGGRVTECGGRDRIGGVTLDRPVRLSRRGSRQRFSRLSLTTPLEKFRRRSLSGCTWPSAANTRWAGAKFPANTLRHDGHPPGSPRSTTTRARRPPRTPPDTAAGEHLRDQGHWL